jgi:uncharacterized membrane protein YccF (DUF307 family)
MLNKIKDTVGSIYSILWLIWVPIWLCIGFTIVAIYTAMWLTAAPVALFSDRREEFIELNPIEIAKYVLKR